MKKIIGVLFLVSCFVLFSGVYCENTTTTDTPKPSPTTPQPTTSAAETTTAATTNQKPTTTVFTTKATETTPPTQPQEATNTYKIYANGKSGLLCFKANFSAHFASGDIANGLVSELGPYPFPLSKNPSRVIYKLKYQNLKTQKIVVGKDAEVDPHNSNCSQLVVKFPDNDFTIKFTNNSKDKDYEISHVLANLDFNTKSKTPEEYHSGNLTSCKVSYGSSYLCKSGVTFDLSSKTANTTFYVKNLQMQLGHFNDSTEFFIAERCDLNILVPIIVGSVLAGLVLIVVIAYLIGRNRSRGGYEEI